MSILGDGDKIKVERGRLRGREEKEISTLGRTATAKQKQTVVPLCNCVIAKLKNQTVNERATFATQFTYTRT